MPHRDHAAWTVVAIALGEWVAGNAQMVREAPDLLTVLVVDIVGAKAPLWVKGQLPSHCNQARLRCLERKLFKLVAAVQQDVRVIDRLEVLQLLHRPLDDEQRLNWDRQPERQSGAVRDTRIA